MAVQFVIGRAGTGKTFRCFRQIIDALRADPLGPAIYWLVPRQTTFVAERELTCASGLSGFCRARVVSFEQFGTEILAECGGSAIPEVTRLGSRMILGHLLRTHESRLRFFSGVARRPGLAAKLEAAFAEFDRSGKNADELNAVFQEIAQDPAPPPDVDADYLRAKLHDLHLLYRAYTDYLGRERLDPARRMQQVLACLSKSTRLRGSTIYVDGFSEFTEFERRVLARLARLCRHMEIMLLMDPDSPALRSLDHQPHDLSLFHRLEAAYCKLARAISDEGAILEQPVLLRQVHRFNSPALGEIEQKLLADPLQPAHGDSVDIELVEASNRRAEVDYAARRIRSLLAQGFRLRDIAVVVRNLDLYQDLISAGFEEHGIAHFIDTRRTAAHHPLLQFIRSALAIAEQSWPHEAVMMLIKTGLSGLTAEESDRLENYVLEHHLRGPVWRREEPWTWVRRLTRDSADESVTAEQDESPAMDALRRRISAPLLPFISRFPNAKTTLLVREIAAELFRMMDRFSVRQTLGQWIEQARLAQQHEQAAEHEQLWDELVKLFDQMVDLLGDQPASLADFRDILDAGLETFDLALTPPTVDEVLIAQIDRTRTPEVKAVLLLGMNDGVFPCAAGESSILSDPERAELQRRNLNVDPGTERRLLDESLLGYVAFTRPSQYMYISRTTSDHAGRPLGPSPFWRRLRELFPSLKPVVLPVDSSAALSSIGTPRQLVTSLMRWARQGTSVATAPGDAFACLYQFLSTYPDNRDPIDLLRHRAWRALDYRNAAKLSPLIAQALLPSPLKATPAQIESFAACPFRHFAKYVLRLRQREEDDIASLNLNTVFHQILDDLALEMLRQRSDFAQFPPEQAAQIVRACSARIGQKLRDEIMLSSARNDYLLKRIERTLEEVIAAQQEAARRGQFKAAFAKVEFGSEGAALPPFVLSTPKGSEIQLHGRIDRIDILQRESAFAILDYRLGKDGLNLNSVYHGLSLQLLTSLLVVQAHGKHLTGQQLTPAAAFYVRLLRGLEKVAHPSDATDTDDPDFPLRYKNRGIFDGQYFGDFDRNPKSGNSAVVAGRIAKGITLGYKNTSDFAWKAEFLALLEQVKRTLADLADQILEGQIDIAPYRIGKITPCASCSYKNVCRFDPAINHYHNLPARRREDVFVQLTQGGNDAR
jgi:ATP-dependent helicase/nuclease subunit B